ncbi:MAG: alpha/beta hydrolase [Clostridia bacterium]|nr:alpha/beta hydrolase [Clostridia bacterium]
MSYEQINPIQQFNFQINRVLTYGEIASDVNMLREKTSKISNFDEWQHVWSDLGKIAEEKSEFLRAAYCFRMAEFFMKATDKNKDPLYKKCIGYFYKAFDAELHLSLKKYDVPFEGKFLNCIKMTAPHPKGTVLVCGGYDSFIEEFVLQVQSLTLKDYDVILFEGPGQGQCLQQKLYFQYDFEKATTAVLDFFKIQKCAMVGISWGGYFALRSAAFEKRIKAVVAYDVMDNGFEVMTHIFPSFLCKIIRAAYAHKDVRVVNGLIKKMQKKSVLADWAISQGMYITASETPYTFYENISRHTLKGITSQITQDVLLLAGEKDHYIPSQQFYRLKKSLSHAHSLSCRMFKESEGGEQHCQIGNHVIATDYIIDWLGKYFVSSEIQ